MGKQFVNAQLDSGLLGSAVGSTQPSRKLCEILMGERVSRATTVFAYYVTGHACIDKTQDFKQSKFLELLRDQIINLSFMFLQIHLTAITKI